LDRHAMLVDQNTEKVIVPLNDELNSEGRLELANSMFPPSRRLGLVTDRN
jgi:probable 2-oxoglutarate dehydrogenase E1 component DHKTD1